MTSRHHSVLIIEDDADLRDMMVELLGANGYSVCTAGNGAEALVRLRAGNTPCIILLDLMMPVMDGWTFCQEMDKEPLFAAIPVVIVSTFPRRDPRRACVRAVAHFSKPLDVGKLLATIGRYC